MYTAMSRIGRGLAICEEGYSQEEQKYPMSLAGGLSNWKRGDKPSFRGRR
jgi:hypothetical protein